MQLRYVTRHPLRIMKPVSARNNLRPLVTTAHSGSGILLAVLLLLTGCAGNPLQPATPPLPPAQVSVPDAASDRGAQETALLAVIAGLQDGQRTVFDGRILEAGTSYTAASGLECRHLRAIGSGGQPAAPQRLTCRQGERLFIAVDVFASAPPGSSQQP